MSIYSGTILARSTGALLSQISRLSKDYSDQLLVFALSPNVQASDLSKLVRSLTTFSSQTIGCLSAPVPSPISQNIISCSLSVFDPQQSVIFRSTIPGRAAPQVGRWHAFREKDNDPAPECQSELHGSVDWESIWNRSTGDNALPSQLQDLNPCEASEIIYFSDSAPEGLSNALAAFPNATKVGLIAASTPFITGRPVTLFHGQSIYDSGAIGIALKHKPESKAQVRSEFLGVTPFSAPMKVTRCEGNIINSLDDSNPTQLLLSSIRESGMNMETSTSFKDDEKKFCLGTIQNGIASQMYNITAGDPSRGNISLETQNAPREGSQVQFFHRLKSTSLELPARFHQSPASRSASFRTVGFMTSADSPLRFADSKTDQSALLLGDGQMGTDGIFVLRDTFLATSENGFILSRPAAALWACTVPGGMVWLEWPAS